MKEQRDERTKEGMKERDAGSCPTRKLSDKTQPNDTRLCRRSSLSDKVRVGQIPPSGRNEGRNKGTKEGMKERRNKETKKEMKEKGGNEGTKKGMEELRKE